MTTSASRILVMKTLTNKIRYRQPQLRNFDNIDNLTTTHNWWRLADNCLKMPVTGGLQSYDNLVMVTACGWQWDGLMTLAQAAKLSEIFNFNRVLASSVISRLISFIKNRIEKPSDQSISVSYCSLLWHRVSAALWRSSQFPSCLIVFRKHFFTLLWVRRFSVFSTQISALHSWDSWWC
jgi:hypothetical protein